MLFRSIAGTGDPLSKHALGKYIIAIDQLARKYSLPAEISLPKTSGMGYYYITPMVELSLEPTLRNLTKSVCHAGFLLERGVPSLERLFHPLAHYCPPKEKFPQKQNKEQ